MGGHQMRRIGLLILVALAMLAAACGKTVTHTVTHTSTTATVTTSTTTATSTTTQAVVPSSPLKCPPGDITMQCRLASQPPPVGSLPKLSPSSTYGIDFGWQAVSASGARAIGAKFGASYLSLDPTKNWTRALVDQYHAAGLKTVAVWETSATRATDGKSAGESDATQARKDATALGMPTNRVIEFAVDCDCTLASIEPYFTGVKAVLTQRLEGVYGGHDQVLGLFNAHLVGTENWQTYAWSGGVRLSCSIAPLFQYLNGNAYDNDTACAPLYGQWPAIAPPPPNPRHPEWLPNVLHTFKVKPGTTAPCSARGRCQTVKTRERAAVNRWDAKGCVNPVKRTVCVQTRQDLGLLAGRITRIATHTPNGKHPVKKPRWSAPHYKSADGHVTTLGGAEYQLGRRTRSKHAIAKW